MGTAAPKRIAVRARPMATRIAVLGTLECKRELRLECVEAVLASLSEMVILELEGCMVIDIEAEANARAVAPAHYGTISGVAVDWLGHSCVYIRVAKIGPISSEPPGDLRVESRGVKSSWPAANGSGMTDQHGLVQELIFRVLEHQVNRRDKFVVIIVVGKCQIIVVDGKAYLEAGHPART